LHCAIKLYIWKTSLMTLEEAFEDLLKTNKIQPTSLRALWKYRFRNGNPGKQNINMDKIRIVLLDHGYICTGWKTDQENWNI